MRHLLVAVACAGLAVSCGSPTAPSVAQVAGVWAGSSRLTSATGGDCVSATVGIGSTSNASLQITQTGSSLTAVATSTANGSSTQYTGTAGTGSLVLNATFSSSAFISGYRCANGASRDLQLTAGTISATVNGNTGSGTHAESYNVFVAGTSTAVGILTLSSTFSMTRS